MAAYEAVLSLSEPATPAAAPVTKKKAASETRGWGRADSCFSSCFQTPPKTPDSGLKF